MVGVNYLETPVSLTLLPATLTVNFGQITPACQLTHFVDTSV